MQFDPRNILVIDFGQLGDVVLSLPALRAIRQRFPNARITVAAGKPANEVVALSGYANEIFEVDRVSLRDGNKIVSIWRIIKFVKHVRQAKFDFVIDLHSLSETNLLGYLSGAPHRLFSRRPGRSLDYLANFNPRPPAEEQRLHAVDRYLDVLKPLGVQNAPRDPVLKTSPAGDAAVDALLKKERAQSGELLVGLFPGAGHIGRRWPMERYAELADHLIRNDRVRIIVFAGPEERSMVSHMRTLFPPATIFFERLTIPQLASAQARLTLMVSNDTGPAHLAAAVGAPVIVIMDRPTPHCFIPVGEQHRMIYSPEIAKTGVDQVYQAAHELISLNRTDQLLKPQISQI
ncbi:MAG TPA: glycosyltransferase family 9 protein [Pyrinomonadaceae bacterium]|nr:glycosyltransferase family 9 protein [Pyrinomonadaceae bacterium]